MKAVYHYNILRKQGNEKSRAILSSLGAALALARHDIQYGFKRYEALKIQADGLTYGVDDILRLTDLDCKGGIIVKLPVKLR